MQGILSSIRECCPPLMAEPAAPNVQAQHVRAAKQYIATRCPAAAGVSGVPMHMTFTGGQLQLLLQSWGVAAAVCILTMTSADQGQPPSCRATT